MTKRDAYETAAFFVREAAEALAEAERLLNAANVVLANGGAWYGQGDVAHACHVLGPQDAEIPGRAGQMEYWPSPSTSTRKA